MQPLLTYFCKDKTIFGSRIRDNGRWISLVEFGRIKIEINLTIVRRIKEGPIGTLKSMKLGVLENKRRVITLEINLTEKRYSLVIGTYHEDPLTLPKFRCLDIITGWDTNF